MRDLRRKVRCLQFRRNLALGMWRETLNSARFSRDTIATVFEAGITNTHCYTTRVFVVYVVAVSVRQHQILSSLSWRLLRMVYSERRTRLKE